MDGAKGHTGERAGEGPGEGHVAVVRRFNRSYTQRVGALDDSFLGTGMPLGTARLLFEIGTAAGTARDLRERLGLDSGYLSRLLRRLDAGDLAAGADRLRPPSGAFVVATCDGAPVACGGVQALDDGAGEIKRMWVHPAWRGAGLGSRLLRHIEGVCRDLGHDVVRLDTNGSLTEALAMYERAGYRHVGRYNDNPYAEHFFAKRLAGASDVGR